MVQIEMIPALQGDCFLIHFGNEKNILIDMGYKDTYKTDDEDGSWKLKIANEQQGAGIKIDPQNYWENLVVNEVLSGFYLNVVIN